MNKHSLFTSNSKKTIVFIVKLVIGVVFFICYIYHVLPQYEQGYNASLIDKVARLKSIGQPKIVLLGHSNLTFGVDSMMLEDAMGMPVVNMGLHGGCGNAFHEEMAKYNIVPGDIYVICHGSYDDDNLIHDTMTAWSSLENHFELWKILRRDDVDTMWRSFPVYLKKSLARYSSGTGNMDPGGVYARSAFNEYGDIGVYREGSEYSFESAVNEPTVGEVTVNRINELNKYITDRGATLLIASYPIGNGCLTADAQEFIDFQDRLEEKLDCPVISNYVDYMFDYKYFFNTNMHLNTEGAKLRTQQLIDDLKRWEETGTDATMESDSYADIVADANLSHITDIYNYLDSLILAKDRYTIFVSAKDDVSSALNDDIYGRLLELGVKADIKNGYRYSYIGILNNGMAEEELFDHELLKMEGNFDNKRMTYSVESGGYDRGNCSSVIINGQEYSRDTRGLNIVVYSNETHRILDEVTFDTSVDELTAIR